MGVCEHRYVHTVITVRNKSSGIDRDVAYYHTAGGRHEATTEKTKIVNVHT